MAYKRHGVETFVELLEGASLIGKKAGFVLKRIRAPASRLVSLVHQFAKKRTRVFPFRLGKGVQLLPGAGVDFEVHAWRLLPLQDSTMRCRRKARAPTGARWRRASLGTHLLPSPPAKP